MYWLASLRWEETETVRIIFIKITSLLCKKKHIQSSFTFWINCIIYILRKSILLALTLAPEDFFAFFSKSLGLKMKLYYLKTLCLRDHAWCRRYAGNFMVFKNFHKLFQNLKMTENFSTFLHFTVHILDWWWSYRWSHLKYFYVENT